MNMKKTTLTFSVLIAACLLVGMTRAAKEVPNTLPYRKLVCD